VDDSIDRGIRVFASQPGIPSEMITIDQRNRGAAAPSADKIRKVFLAIAQDLRICLVCGSLFTMRGAAEHCDTMIAAQVLLLYYAKRCFHTGSLVLLKTSKEKDS
jgi:hypothetical protein